MTAVIDHPDDVAARVAVRDQLRARREDMDLSAQAVARLAGFAYECAVRDMERRPAWELWRTQQWARGLGLRLRLGLSGLNVPAPDMRALVLAETTPFGGFDEDQQHLAAVAHDLTRTRVHRNVSRSALARLCGVDERAFRDFEKQPLYSQVRTWQRYPRALGGCLELQLEPAVVGAAS